MMKKNKKSVTSTKSQSRKSALTNDELHKLAVKHEKYSNNNNVFNKKNMSDHSKQS
jgi:hypothetical protein